MDTDELAREWLIEISLRDVPQRFARQVATTCAPLEEVHAAYVARQRRMPRRLAGTKRWGKRLTVGIELRSPPKNPAESAAADATVAMVLRGVARSRHSVGVAVLTEAALSAWRQRGVRVFTRAS